MNSKVVASIAFLVFGLLVLIVLVILGGVVKKTIDDEIYSRLKYELPKGYKNDPNFQECYKSVTSSFDEEYYLWNLTNLADVLTGAKPNFNLTGPFAYTQWYCEYEHSVSKEGILTYRQTIDGYMFLRDNSSSDDDVLITNANPAYMGLLEQLGGDDAGLASAMTGGAVSEFVAGFQANVQDVILQGSASVLAAINQKVQLGMGAGLFYQLGEIAIFTNGFSYLGFDGWATYASSINATADTDLSSTTKDMLFATWTNATALAGFSQLNEASVVAVFNVTDQQAQLLLSYMQYVFTSPTLAASLYGQWANGSVQSTSVYPGWEIGLPNPTGISSADVALLFSPSSNCSLTAVGAGYLSWLGALSSSNVSKIVCGNLTETQKFEVLVWLGNFIKNNATGLLQQEFGLASWDDFGYAQWGREASGQSLGGGVGYVYEIAGIKNLFGTQCIFPDDALTRDLWEGPHGLYNTTNLSLFSSLGLSNNYDEIASLWPALDLQHAACLGAYAQGVIPLITQPQIDAVVANGSGLFVTRTVRDWLFNAYDPLLKLLHSDPNVGLMTNTTLNRTQADAGDFTYVRVYTGDNDLYWSLMPYNDGELLPYWRGDVFVNGYNGSQFLPNGYLDNKKKLEEHPLELYNSRILRAIPFENKGSEKWNGVDVRYLTLSPEALLNQTVNPLNYPYYAEYSGVINKTSNPPYLPVFLTTPDFHTADPVFYENVTFTDNLFGDYDPTEEMSHHRLAMFILVEPTLGSSVWGNLPIQINFKVTPISSHPDLVPAFYPIYWNAIGDIATAHDIHTIKTSLYANERAWKVFIGIGAGVGGSIVIVASVLLHHYRRHENELQEVSMNSTS